MCPVKPINTGKLVNHVQLCSEPSEANEPSETNEPSEQSKKSESRTQKMSEHLTRMSNIRWDCLCVRKGKKNYGQTNKQMNKAVLEEGSIGHIMY